MNAMPETTSYRGFERAFSRNGTLEIITLAGRNCVPDFRKRHAGDLNQQWYIHRYQVRGIGEVGGVCSGRSGSL